MLIPAASDWVPLKSTPAREGRKQDSEQCADHSHETILKVTESQSLDPDSPFSWRCKFSLATHARQGK